MKPIRPKVKRTRKGYIILELGFFVCRFQITLVVTHITGYMQARNMCC